MMPDDIAELPEVVCDLNASFGGGLYFSTCSGTTIDLERLGLTAGAAVGPRFLFSSGDDCNPAGELADIMCVGRFVRDAEHGVAIQMEDEVFRRSHNDGSFNA